MLVTTVIFVVNVPDIVKFSLFTLLRKGEKLFVYRDFVIKFAF